MRWNESRAKGNCGGKALPGQQKHVLEMGESKVEFDGWARR